MLYLTKDEMIAQWAKKFAERIEYWRGSPKYDLRTDLHQAGLMLLQEYDEELTRDAKGEERHEAS